MVERKAAVPGDGRGDAMRRVGLIAGLTLLSLIAWAALVGFGTLGGWGRTPLAPRGDAAAFMTAANAVIDAESRGNAAFVLIEDGRVLDQHFASIGRPVDGDSLFQVASLSKWITAWGVMTLVESGRIDLDAPVSTYLTRWTLPPSEFDNEGVTVRRLLSHTAGLTDGLGYGGFAPGTDIQTLEQSLTRASDASPGRDGAVKVGAEPGSAWRYSGGGYTLLQLIIEEVSGESFDVYMQRAVLQPLGMTRSTFVLRDGAGETVAEFFDTDGSLATHYQFTAQAAASLYTSAADLTRFIQAHLAGPNGEEPGRDVLRPETLTEMRQPHGYQFGAEIWGLGVILYAPNNSGSYIIGHDGDNAPAINTATRFDPESGDGIIVLATGNPRLATNLAGEWVFWRTGNIDLFDVISAAPRALLILGAGALVIVLAGIYAAWRSRRRV
jgi:CubicO group peptidase (beta-lactamase class C family)